MAAALNGGYHLAYLIGAVLTVVAIVAAVTVIRSPQPAAQEHGPGGRARVRRGPLTAL